MKIEINALSESSFEDAIKKIYTYKKRLEEKCEVFVKRLAEVGVQVAKQNVGSYGKYISFTIETSDVDNECQALMIATNTGFIESEWRTKDGIKSADVSPLLMVEFGSGFKAQNPLNVPGVGQGTFPDQQHAFNPNGWWYMDLNGEWHHSYGVSPKMPMYKAVQEMRKQIEIIATEVFGDE